jgi:hypothetical protein
MTAEKRFELICGVLTGLLGVAATLVMVHDAYQRALFLEREFRATREVVFDLIVFFGPGFLVCLGAYMDTVLRNSGGKILILMGSFFLTAIFVLILLIAGYGATYRIGIRSSLVAMSIVTLLTSLMRRALK